MPATIETIDIGIPLFPDLDDWAGVTIERLECENGRWGAVVKDGSTAGAYYAIGTHPRDWTVEKCAYAIQTAADHRYMMQGPPGTATKEDVFDAGERLMNVIASVVD